MKMKRLQRLVPYLGYPMVMLLLGLAWWNPLLWSEQTPIDLLVLMDESNSVDPVFSNQQWRQLHRLVPLLPPASEFALIRFADRAREEISKSAWTDEELRQSLQRSEPPRHLALDPQYTAISRALELAMMRFDRNRPGAILLLSDGRENVSQSPPPLPEDDRDKIIFWSSPTEPSAGARITSLNAPTRVRPGAEFMVSLAIDSDTARSATLNVKLNDRQVRQQTLQLPSQGYQVVRLRLTAPATGLYRLTLQLHRSDGRLLAERVHAFEAVEARRLLYLSHQTEPILDLGPLARQGWRTIPQRPDQMTEPASFRDASLVLLQDIAVQEMPARMWQALADAVTNWGTGLVVLGGPHSFGSGAYRHSHLEELLPVTAESARPEPAAAFLFLVDKSGSMDDSATQPQSRLATALRAIEESSASLRPRDYVGVIAFDRDIQTLLPLQAHGDPRQLLQQDWHLSPSGGTRLAPALDAALAQLSQVEVEKRFLILITDGFVKRELPPALLSTLRDSKISLIALAIGAEADFKVLEQLAATGHGRVLRVDRTAEIPYFMRHELEQQRHSWQTSEATPRTLRNLPFLESTPRHWQTIKGYQLTRPKPLAIDYIATQEGDPLLAVSEAGTARVVALPGGPLLPAEGSEIMTNLLTWADRQLEHPRLHLSHVDRAGVLQLRLDAVDSEGQWNLTPYAHLSLQTPAGLLESHELPLIAPGRYEKSIPVPVSGTYLARLEVNGERLSQIIDHTGNLENSVTPVAPWLLRGLERHDIRPWSETALRDFMTDTRHHLPLRELWLFCGLALFISIIVHERRAGLGKYLAISRGGRKVDPVA